MRASPFFQNASRFAAFLALAAALLTTGASAQTRAEDLFQRALRMERVTGDLEGAIRLYEQVVDTGDRTFGARSLVRIAESYERLGREGARDAYLRIIEEFGDQAEPVALARERLAEMERLRGEQPAKPRGITIRQVHKWPYGEGGPFAVTPDGGSLVFLDYNFGNLAILDLEDGRTRDLAQDSSWSAWGAEVSPDGRSVSYLLAEAATSSLHIVGIDGSGSRVLYREAGCPVSYHVWTSDGRQIVAIIGCGGEPPALTGISVADGKAEVLAQIGEIGGIALSSDDRILAYDRPEAEDDGNFDIWMVPLDGGPEVPLVRHPANDEVLGWMPGSDMLLFRSDRDGTMDAWAIQVPLEGPAGLPRLVQRNMGPVDALGFSEGGDLFYSSYKRWFSTGVAPFDLASGIPNLESSQGILGSNMQPVWAPDGQRLAFVPELEGPSGVGGPYRRPLHIYDLASGRKEEMASDLGTRNPQWSPDNRFVLFCGRDTLLDTRRGEGGLYVVDVESGEVTEILDLDPATQTSFWSDLGGVWSHDGDAIIYAIYDHSAGEGRLVWLDLETREERVLFRDPRLTTRLFAVSPDGGRLAFSLRSEPSGYTSGIHSGGEFLIMDLASGETEEVHHIEGPGGRRLWSLQWSPDEEHLFYTLRGDDSRTWVWRVPVSGGPAERLWAFEEGPFDAMIQLSPDGRQVAYTTYHQEMEVWVMENQREVLMGGDGR
jgi:Tol biopolymer transport system component